MRLTRHRLLLALGLLLLAVNLVAFCHAWRFTHFTAAGSAKTKNPEELSLAEKLWVLGTGIRNPKPMGSGQPAFPFQTIYLDSPNGRLEAWDCPQPGARGTVALFHGYTSDKSKLLTEAAYFRQLGYSVFLIDFAGNGGSAGNQTTVGHHEADDVAAVCAYLHRQRPGQPLVLYGVSMGAVAILRAEAELGVPASANVLECPYGSMLQTARNRFQSMGLPDFPMAWLLVFWGGVQNNFWAFGLNGEDYATRVQTPTLLLWGEADPRVSRRETETIFAHLRGPKARRYFPVAGHEPYWHRYPAEWQGELRKFLAPISGVDAGAGSVAQSLPVTLPQTETRGRHQAIFQ